MRGFLILLVLLVVGGVAVAFYQDWFHLTVNKGRMEEDKTSLQQMGRHAENKIEATVEKMKGHTGAESSVSKTASGRVTKIEPADDRFLMTTGDNKELAIYTDTSSKLRLDNQDIAPELLRVEDEVKVTYHVTNGKNVASAVTVTRKSSAGSSSGTGK